jgi:hypothetical protein
MFFHTIQERVFDITIFLSYTLVFLSAIGFSSNAPSYLKTLDYYLRIYICLFLILRFNPYKKYILFFNNDNDKFNKLDRKIAFSAGIFILTTSIIHNYINEIKYFIDNNITPN